MRHKPNSKLLSFSILSLLLSGCETMVTRSEVREIEQKRQVQDQVVNLQRTHADTSNRFADIEGDMRELNGRLEVVENRMQQSQNEREKLRALAENSNSDSSKKVSILQEEIVRMQEQLNAVTAEMNSLKAAVAANAESASAAAAAERAAAKKDAFELAEEHFEKKDFRKAILNYQKYRDSNPKSKNFPEATFKIGASFQELGMKDEARTFFDEVISKFPNSSEAKKARTRLKSLKK